MTRAMLVVAGSVGTIALGMSMVVPSPVGGVAGFGDVEADRFYAVAVQWMADNAITTGTAPGCFYPDDPVSRGQGAAFLWRMAGHPDGSPPHLFVDVTAPWQQEAVSWMAASGITTGTSSDRFSPNEDLTRGQLAALLHRLSGSPDAAPSTFTDVSAPWQVTPVAWLQATGITTGTSPTTFSPDEPATRGEIATLLYRYSGSPTVIVDAASPLCTSSDAASLFEVRCAVCHGAGGSGGFAPSLIDTALTLEQIKTTVEEGRGAMPSFAGVLTAAEIDAVSAHVADL